MIRTLAAESILISLSYYARYYEHSPNLQVQVAGALISTLFGNGKDAMTTFFAT